MLSSHSHVTVSLAGMKLLEKALAWKNMLESSHEQPTTKIFEDESLDIDD